jgi:enoyl-CoA hydratase
MSADPYVRVEIDDRIATITVDRPEKLNALNPQVIQELDQAFDSVRSDDGVGGVILTGSGEKAFVAGADIGVLAEMDSLSGVQVSREGQEVFRRIETFPKPVIAAVGGYALGGGCELALACHLRVASDTARFGLPEVGLGIIPGYGGTVRLTRLVGLGRALEMILTGDMVSGEDAARIGLANKVVPADELMSATREFLGKILGKGPVAVEMAIKSTYLAVQSTMEDALTFESSLFGLLASTSDMREGMGAFLEKRKPDFQGR